MLFLSPFNAIEPKFRLKFIIWKKKGQSKSATTGFSQQQVHLTAAAVDFPEGEGDFTQMFFTPADKTISLKPTMWWPLNFLRFAALLNTRGFFWQHKYKYNFKHNNIWSNRKLIQSGSRFKSKRWNAMIVLKTRFLSGSVRAAQRSRGAEKGEPQRSTTAVFFFLEKVRTFGLGRLLLCCTVLAWKDRAWTGWAAELSLWVRKVSSS